MGTAAPLFPERTLEEDLAPETLRRLKARFADTRKFVHGRQQPASVADSDYWHRHTHYSIRWNVHGSLEVGQEGGEGGLVGEGGEGAYCLVSHNNNRTSVSIFTLRGVEIRGEFLP